jgi:hypothetical protein
MTDDDPALNFLNGRDGFIWLETSDQAETTKMFSE